MDAGVDPGFGEFDGNFYRGADFLHHAGLGVETHYLSHGGASFSAEEVIGLLVTGLPKFVGEGMGSQRRLQGGDAGGIGV